MAKKVMMDADLLSDLRAGLSTPEIAAERGISEQAVNIRRSKLRFEATTIAVVAKPEAQQLVTAELDTIALLQVCMQRLTMLSDAYHAWLLDPKDTSKYFIGPRATEIEVVYIEPGHKESSKTTLQSLLNRIEQQFAAEVVERKCADPRTELRATVGTISSTVAQMVELAQMLADTRAMQTLRDTILEVLRSVDEEIAAKVVSALRSRLVVGGVPLQPGAVDAGGGSGRQ